MLTLPFPPAVALLLLTAGALLMAWEANRPGLLLPGAAGLTAALVALASVAKGPHPALSLSLLVAAFLCMSISFRRPFLLLQLLAAALWLLAFLSIAPTATALPCALVLAASTSWFARVAFRARRNKGHR